MKNPDGKPSERRLGRGLEALLGQPIASDPKGGLPAGITPGVDAHQPRGDDGRLIQLNVYEIDTNPYQPRTEFDEEEIAALAGSLSDHGLLQPIVVRREGDRYQLISGERRWRAAIRAGWSEVPATVRDANDQQVAEMTIVENLQRKDLGPLEKAVSFRQYLDRFGASQEELAGRLSIDRSTVANLMRLLELPTAVQELIRTGSLSAGHGRALLPLGEEKDQLAFARRIHKEQLSVRATERLVADSIRTEDDPLGGTGDKRASATQSPRSQHLASLEQQLRVALGTAVDIRQAAKGRGTITIHFTSREEFNRLYAELGGRDGLAAKAG
jgi:ParB family chromosome partitioning protein